MDAKQRKSTWARLIKKVYSVDPLICPRCGGAMKIIAIILDSEETTKILPFQRKGSIWQRLEEPRRILISPYLITIGLQRS